MALYVFFENKNTLLCIYFICLLFNLQMCQIILTDPVHGMYQVPVCNNKYNDIVKYSKKSTDREKF